ncbi:hypothetical protein F5884DRAFT_864611 [Xylogone sp. PMI_703]|nr:hypothetical protein F5884DRAFT_864611 [Xylogone sp. PMI_703]
MKQSTPLSFYLALKISTVLRQGSRCLASKTTQDRFESYYRTKGLHVTPHALLEAFVDVTGLDRLGCQLQELTLVGIPYCSEDNSQHSSLRIEADLLSQAFKNIATYNDYGRPLSLALEVAAIQNDIDQVSGRKPQQNALPLLSNPKSLSIGLSDRNGQDLSEFGFFHCSDEEDTSIVKENPPEGAKEKSPPQRSYVGLAELLQLTHSVENLEIHYYRINNANHPLKDISYERHKRLLKYVAESKQLPKLKQCKLRGIVITEDNLLTFMQQTTPRRLCLERAIMCSGTFKSVFDYCTSETSEMEELDLKDLFEKEKQFFPTDQVDDSGQSIRRTSSLRRVGVEVKAAD